VKIPLETIVADLVEGIKVAQPQLQNPHVRFRQLLAS
jgi:hypothetical protein